MDILIAVGIALCTIVLAWVGIAEATPVAKRIIVGVSAVLLIAFTVWATARAVHAAERNETTLNDLPKRVAEYIRNTTPPPGLIAKDVAVGVPNPPTGLVAVVDGHTGAAGVNIADEILNFLAAQGNPPRRNSGESDVDFLIRSNAWYRNAMDAYNKSLQAQAETMSRVMIEAHILPDNVLTLAKDPVNIIGIRALANELKTAGAAYEKRFSH